jgi:serine/threonine-protein kinase
MDAQRWRLARELFEAVIDFPPEDWAAMLAEHCPDDAQLRVEVLELLHADAAATRGTAMVDQAPNVVAELANRLAGDEAARATAALVASGLRLGPFRLVREVGRGGMGAVWLAERDDGAFEQQVAIKLIKADWDAADVYARFRAERQILANLSHPNIAHLVDGGVSADGKPWLALEYVDGVDLRSWCDRERLSLDKRLRVFLTVCEAVSHAHARLVVHRDLKPSNILVRGDGTVKLLDFGIAKLIRNDSTAASATRVFTPEYAAPEQVRGETVTTAVDVYALGLVLYELLTGRRPYKIDKSTPAAYERAILDQEPTKPSAIVTRDDGEAAQRRELTPERLRRELRGDLDAIVLKALRKEPAQRYASVADFAADVTRHLERRPVAARRGGRRYRAARFLRRHAIAAAAVALAFAVLAAALGVVAWQRDVARTEARKARSAVDFLVGLFTTADPAKTAGAGVTAQELLDRGAERIDRELADTPGAQAELSIAIGRAYQGLGNNERALAQYERAVAQRRALGEPFALAQALSSLSMAQKSLGHNAETRATIDEARTLVVDAPSGPERDALVAQLAYGSAMLHFLDGRHADAEAEYRESLRLRLALENGYGPKARDTAMMLSRVVASQKRHDEADRMIVGVVEAIRAARPVPLAELVEALDALGSAQGKRGREADSEASYREAAQVAEQVYGPDHWYVAIQLNNAGKAATAQGQYDEAIALLERAVAGARKALPPEHLFVPSALKNLADAERGAGRTADACRDYGEALRSLELKPGRKRPDPVELRARLAECAAP